MFYKHDQTVINRKRDVVDLVHVKNAGKGVYIDGRNRRQVYAFDGGI